MVVSAKELDLYWAFQRGYVAGFIEVRRPFFRESVDADDSRIRARQNSKNFDSEPRARIHAEGLWLSSRPT
jgi:hypothetical protein